MRHAVGLGCLLAASLVGPRAWAQPQDRPPPLPLRDVDVVYRSGQGAGAVDQRSRFDVGMQRMRLDTPTPGLYMIVDYRTNTMSMVSDADRGVVDIPAPPGVLPGTGGAGVMERRGQDQVAGLACTEWESRDNQGHPAQTCFTADGVLLRARRGDMVLAQAVRVTYGPLDKGLFAAPASYNRVVRRP